MTPRIRPEGEIVMQTRNVLSCLVLVIPKDDPAAVDVHITHDQDGALETLQRNLVELGIIASATDIPVRESVVTRTTSMRLTGEQRAAIREKLNAHTHQGGPEIRLSNPIDFNGKLVPLDLTEVAEKVREAKQARDSLRRGYIS